MAKKVLQEDLLRDYPRDQSVAAKTVGPQIILLAFFKGGVEYLLSSGCQGSPLLSTTFKRAALHIHFRLHLLMQPVRSHGFLLIKFTEEVLTQSSSLSRNSLNPFKKHGGPGDLVGEGGIPVMSVRAAAKSPTAFRNVPLFSLLLPMSW